MQAQMQTKVPKSTAAEQRRCLTPSQLYATHVKPVVLRARESVKHLEDRRLADLEAVRASLQTLADNEREAYDRARADAEQSLRAWEADAKSVLRKILDS